MTDEKWDETIAEAIEQALTHNLAAALEWDWDEEPPNVPSVKEALAEPIAALVPTLTAAVVAALDAHPGDATCNACEGRASHGCSECDGPGDAEQAGNFAATLRTEAARRGTHGYVHHAVIRDQMRTMADRIERWERGEYLGRPAGTCPTCGWLNGRHNPKSVACATSPAPPPTPDTKDGMVRAAADTGHQGGET